MTTTIALPGDHSAVLKDGDEISNKDMKTLRRAARQVGVVGQKLKGLGMDELASEDESQKNDKALEILSHLSDDEDDVLDLFQRVCAVVRLQEWSLERPLPSSPEEIDDLPRPIYSVLTTEAAKLDLTEDFSLDAGATDPKALTESSADSDQPSTEEPS